MSALTPAQLAMTALRQSLERAERACNDDNTDAALDYVRDALRHAAALVEPADIDEIVTVPPVTVPAYRPGTPPDLVALVQEWQAARADLQIRVDVEELPSHDQAAENALHAAHRRDEAAMRAVLGWTPRQPEPPPERTCGTCAHSSARFWRGTEAEPYEVTHCPVRDGAWRLDDGCIKGWTARPSQTETTR